MAIVLGTPGADGLSEAVGVLREWQYDGAPWQLHPGDLGWFWRFGAEATAAAVRTWSRDGRILAVGLLDEPTLLRLTISPDAQRDEELAQQLVDDVTEPERGVLMDRKVYIEAPKGALVHDLLFEDGWTADESWTPLRRDLTEPVKDPGVRIEVIGPEQAHVRTAVQRGIVRQVDVHRRALARDGGRTAVRRRPVSGRVRRPGQRGGGGDGVVGRSGKARVARADGRPPGPSRSRLRKGARQHCPHEPDEHRPRDETS